MPKKRKRVMAVKKRPKNADTGDSSPEDGDTSPADDYRPASGGPRGVKRGRYNVGNPATGGNDGGSENDSESERDRQAPTRKYKRPPVGSEPNGNAPSRKWSGEKGVEEEFEGDESDLERIPASQVRDKPAGRGRMIPKGEIFFVCRRWAMLIRNSWLQRTERSVGQKDSGGGQGARASVPAYRRP
jgi:hypothetical protein